MDTLPSGSRDRDLEEFTDKLGLYFREESKPISELVGAKLSDGKWCEKIISYLMENCSFVTDRTAQYYLDMLVTICSYYPHKDTVRLLQFAERKIAEIEVFVEKAETLDREQQNNLRTSAHMVVFLIKAIGSNEAVALMEKLHDENKDNEYGALTNTCLAFMKKSGNQ